jgi:hypothetical protein
MHRWHARPWRLATNGASSTVRRRLTAG